MRFPKGYRWNRFIMICYDSDGDCQFAAIRLFRKFQIAFTWQPNGPDQCDWKELSLSWG